MPKYFEDMGSDVLARLIKILDIDGMLPTDAQYRRADTIQAHNANSITNGTKSASTTWIDCDGFSDIAVTAVCGNAISYGINILWSNDGATSQGYDGTTPTGGSTLKSYSTTIKARYCKIEIQNNDAASQTFSSWAYLKV